MEYTNHIDSRKLDKFTKVRSPIEFLNVGVSKYLEKVMIPCTIFFINTKFIDLIEFYKFVFDKKRCYSKAFASISFCHTNIEKSYLEDAL